MEEAEPSLTMQVTDSSVSKELYFLIANFLTNASPCSRAAAVLQEELRERNLLGISYDWECNARPASFEDVRSRHRMLPPDQLARVASEYLRQAKGAAGGGGISFGVGDGAVQEVKGPAASRSLLSRVEPLDTDREENERARAELAVRVVEACVRTKRVQVEARTISGELAIAKSKLEALIVDMEEEAAGGEGRIVTRGKRRVETAGQESQAELTRIAWGRTVDELLAKGAEIPMRVGLAQDEREAAVAEARRRHALRNTLTRYGGKAIPTMLSNRQATGRRFGIRMPGSVSLRGMSSKLVGDHMRPIVTANGHGISPVYCIKFDQTGQYIFTGADDHLIKIWSTSSGRLMLSLRGHSSVITDLAVSPDNTMLVSSSEDRNLRVWDPRTGASLAVLRGHEAPVNLVRFAPGDSVAMSASEDGTCRVWDLRNRDSLATDDVIPIVLPHKNHAGNNIPVKCLSVSPAGNLIAAGCDDGAVRVWAYGDANDDAAWGGGKHNTRGAGRDKFGSGQVYRREAPQQPRPVLPPPVVAQATSASPAAPESPDGNMLNGLAAATAAALGGPSRVATAGVTAEGGGAAEVETIGPGSLARAALGSASSASRAWNRVGDMGAVVGALGGNDLPGLVGEQMAAVAAAGGEGDSGSQVEERGRERRTRGRGREGGSGADDAGATGKDKGELEVRLGTMLFGHVSGVTDTRFSGLGDRILTASMEDGTARVYSWGPRFSNLQHLVLKVCRQDATAAGAGRGRGRGGGAGGGGQKPSLDDACWSCDDEVIVTTESRAAGPRVPEGDSGSQFKVWDSRNGILLHTVKRTHISSVSALMPHPNESGSLASVGIDGAVCTWDVGPGRSGRGRCTARFDNILAAGPQSEALHHGMPVTVLDGVFSPDGGMLAVTDLRAARQPKKSVVVPSSKPRWQIGRWTLYGTGQAIEETVKGKQVPLEQFFTSDYREVIRDERDNVLDAFTQLPPHLAQTGQLVDLIGNSYPEECQTEKAFLKGPLPLPPGLVAQRLQAVQAIALDLRRALAAHEARASARGFSVPQLLSNAARGGRGHPTPSAGVRRWQDLESAAAESKNMVLDIRRSSGGGGARSSSGGGGRGTRGVGVAAGAGASGGRRGAAVRRGFYTEPDEDDLDDDVYMDDGEGDPDSEYEYAPRAGKRRRSSARGSGGRAANGNHPTREERARRREQGSGGQVTGGGGGRRGAGGTRRSIGVVAISSEEEEDEEEEDEEEIEDGDGSRRRGKGKRKGKGKGRPRGSGNRGANGRGGGSGGGAGEGPLPVMPDDFNNCVVAVGSEDEADDGGSGADSVSRTRDRTVKINRKTLECALCHKGDSPEHPLPGRVLGVHPVMEGATPLWVHDGCALYSPMVCRDEGTDSLCNITAEVKRGRQLSCTACRGKGATIGCLVETCKSSYHFPCAEATGWSFSTAIVGFHCRRCRKRLGSRGGGGGEGAGGTMAESYLWTGSVPADRAWLTADNPADAMQRYCPQVGEVVMYFPQGHAQYLHTFPENKTPPYKLFRGRPAVVRCQVKEVSYAFPTDHEDTGCLSVVCRITLDVLGFPVRVSAAVTTRQGQMLAARGENPLAFRLDSFGDPARHGDPASTFTVSLRDSGVADFLVPERRFEESVDRDWKPCQRVVMEWKEEVEDDGGGGAAGGGGVGGTGGGGGGTGGVLTPFFGVVAKVARDQTGSETWPNSPWDCLSIKWDLDGTTSLLGPWEPRPVTWDEGEEPPPIDPNKLRACLPSDLRDRLVSAIRKVVDTDDAVPFAEPVDVENYHAIVPVPMDLGLIVRRLEKDYYCCVDAVEFDCNLVYANCTKYNRPGSDIVKLASRVTDRLVQAIKTVTEGGGDGGGGSGSGSGSSSGLYLDLDGGEGGGGGSAQGESNGASFGGGGGLRSRQSFGSERGLANTGQGGDDEEEQEEPDERDEEEEEEEDEDIAEEGEEEGGEEADASLRSKRKRSPTARYIDEIHGVVAPRGAVTRGRGRSSTGGAEVVAANNRGSKRRRASSSSSRSYFYRDDSDEGEEAEDHDQDERGREARASEDRHYAVSNGGRLDNGSAFRAAAEANGVVATLTENSTTAGKRKAGGDVSGSSSGGGSGSASMEGPRGISPVVEEMLRHQGDVLERHGNRELILRFARQRWEEPPPPVEGNLRQVAENLLDLLGLIDEDGFFAEPVTESAAPGYIAAILRPMDLGTMRRRAAGGTYLSVSDLQDDLVLVVANCLSYNAPDTIFSEAGVSLAGQAGGAYSQALASVAEVKGWEIKARGSVGRSVGGGAGRGALMGAGAAGGASGGHPRGVKRKRGRPRKHPLPPS